MGSEHYCLRWNNHQSNLLGVFSQLLESESLVDVTLACTEGPSIRAHKVVLSACSSYFQTLFLDHPNRHPIVILKDVRFSELRTLVDFMYKGEVNVEYCQLSALLKTAESLKVKGLADMTNINAAVATRDEQQHHHHHHQQHHQHHQQQQQHHHHHNNDTPRETRNDTMRERDKEHRIDKEYNDKDNIKDELKLQNSHKEHIQQNKHNSLINQHINDNSEAVDMTECPLTPKREIDSSPERPLALDRPRRDSDDAASLDDTRASISPVSVHSGPSDMSLTNNTTITTAATTTTTAATTTTTTSSSSSSSSSLSNNNNNNSTNTTTTSTTTTTTTTPPTPTTTPGALSQSRLPSPHSTEPLAGPSGLPPVQQVPLSLKKEMDWDRSSDERCASSELSTDYRLPPDPVSLYSMSLALGLDAGGWGALVERASATGSPLLGQHGSSSSLGVAGLASLARRCTVCLATFPSAWLLERHALLQHAGQSKEEKPFTCEQCGQRYRYRSAYVKHREQNHRARLPADKLFTCDVCGMQFRYLKSFKKHRLNHALERLQRGPENLASGISILTERAERSDQVSSTGEPSQLETGSEAASPSATGVSGGAGGGGGVDDIAKDSTETGDINSETTSEQHDNNQDITEQAIDLHTGRNNVNSNDQLNNINTDINNITTERVLSIVKAHHDTEKRERRFACPFCGKCVRSKENLKLHVRKHTGERPFVCLFCGRAFGGKSDLTRHLRIHTGERPYHCEMCGKCFARADYLSKHLTTHIHQR